MRLPIDAVPDITNPQVLLNTAVRALAPEEIEKLVTLPLESQMAGLPGMIELRSLSKFGLSQIRMTFEDGVDLYRTRQLVTERLLSAGEKLPPDLQPRLAPVVRHNFMNQPEMTIVRFNWTIGDGTYPITLLKLAKKIAALALLVLWATMTNHCDLEEILHLDFLACETQGGESHQPADCDTDVCATLESGFYKSEQRQVTAPRPAVTSLGVLVVLSQLSVRECSRQPVANTASPPELVHTWHFSFRTALSPRAPSFVS